MALFAGIDSVPGIGAKEKLTRFEHNRSRSSQHMRPDIAGHDVDFVFFDQFFGFLFADFWIKTVILEQDFDIPATHFMADMIHRQLNRHFHLLTNQRRRRCQRRDKTDFDIFSLSWRHHRRNRRYDRRRNG